MCRNVLRVLMGGLVLAGSLGAVPGGFDSGMGPEGLAQLEVSAFPPGTWFRLRGVERSVVRGAAGMEVPLWEGMPEVSSVSARRAALQVLADRGWRTTAFVRWGNSSWPGGVRAGGGQRMPVDLRDAYERGRLMGATYGDLMDVWEIENEPDISFVADNPETMAAFFKAISLGLRDGAATAGAREGRSPGTADGELPVFITEYGYGLLDEASRLTVEGRVRQWQWFRAVSAQIAKLQVEAPMAFYLPPYHERGINEFGLSLATGNAGAGPVANAPRAGETVNRSTGDGARKRVDGAGEDGAPKRSGGGTDAGAQWARKEQTEDGQTVDGGRRSEVRIDEGRGAAWTAGGLTFRPGDFGASAPQRWMAAIGRDLGGGRLASPALAWLLRDVQATGSLGLAWRSHAKQRPVHDAGARRVDSPVAGLPRSAVIMPPLALPPGPYFERWLENGAMAYSHGLNFHYYGYETDFAGVHRQYTDATAANAGPATPSPVVIDFVPGDDLQQAKAYRGYMVRGEAAVPHGQTVNRLNGQTVATGAENGRRDGGRSDGATEASKTGRLSPHGRTVKRLGSEGKLVAGRESLEARQVRTGRGALVLYNFSDTAVTGRLVLPEEVRLVAGRKSLEPSSQSLVASHQSLETGAASEIITLFPGERREVPVEIRVPFTAFEEMPVRVAFEASDNEASDARWVSSFYPWLDRMAREFRADFDFSLEAGAANRVRLLSRSLAREEPRLHEQGRWLVSEGVRVEELPDRWRFHVAHFPNQPLRPAMAELPLPADFVFSGGDMLLMNYREERLAPHGDAVKRSDGDAVAAMPHGDAVTRSDEEAGGSPDFRYRTRTGTIPSMLEVLWRTENGNLFGVWPRLFPNETWQSYSQMASNFTMFFFGRAELPWRFAENRPAALVFHFRPQDIPAVIEVTKPEVARWGSGEAAR